MADPLPRLRMRRRAGAHQRMDVVEQARELGGRERGPMPLDPLERAVAVIRDVVPAPPALANT
jgi:hypothetical protein